MAPGRVGEKPCGGRRSELSVSEYSRGLHRLRDGILTAFVIFEQF